MKKKLFFLSLLSLTTTTQCVQSLEKLALQKYCKNLPRILQNLKQDKLSLDIQDSIKKQLIETHSSLFPGQVIASFSSDCTH